MSRRILLPGVCMCVSVHRCDRMEKWRTGYKKRERVRQINPKKRKCMTSTYRLFRSLFYFFSINLDHLNTRDFLLFFQRHPFSRKNIELFFRKSSFLDFVDKIYFRTFGAIPFVKVLLLQSFTRWKLILKSYIPYDFCIHHSIIYKTTI